MRNVAILGGSFDPVHIGHLAIARAALDAGMDHVVWVPAAASPFKQDRPPAPTLDRWTMTVLATLHEPRFRVSRLELDRPPPSYSIETARALAAEIGLLPGVSAATPPALWWVVGADHLSELEHWHQIEDLVQVVGFLVVPRADLEGETLAQELERLPPAIRQAVRLLDMPLVNASSTEVRHRAARGQALSDLCPESVSTYIARYGLYVAPPAQVSETVSLAEATERVLDYLEREMPPKRRRHIHGVADTAEILARRFGADPAKARLAGLAHDIVRLWTPEALLEACRARSLPVLAFDLAYPLPRLHGLLAAYLLRDWFKVDDVDIQAAIASHTLGRPGMSLLERILYVADYTEPGRGPEVDPVRAAAEHDLEAALRLAMDSTLSYLIRKGHPIHPQALEARNALLPPPSAS